MALIGRIARLFKADIHSLLDSLEEPLAVLKQAVRDMEDAIEQDEGRLEELTKCQAKLTVQRTDQDKVLVQVKEQIALCFRAKDENLGRSTVRRKLEIEKRLKFIERQGHSLTPVREKLERELTEKRNKLTSVKEKMDLFSERSAQANASSQESCLAESDYRVSDEEVQVAFLAEQEKLRAGSSTAVNKE